MSRSPLLKPSRKTTRLWILCASLLCLGSATFLVLNAFSSNIVFFMAPSQLRDHPPHPSRVVRLGGMVVAGSLHHHPNTPDTTFDVTDGQVAITVHYTGILPDLFREGQSVVAVGELQTDQSFKAQEVLAKHDETYMPKEVADALKRSGKWDPRFGPPPDAASWNRMTATSHDQHP
ncbi:cytochrome c maturation protein CcmE [Saccharibacter sp. 17.LH.SD]|uniref:cytochrome c maturation protein CcmE n=1 Tax=Saccharibacter sp. 17.LH.SD TaxID=2689393 RepID=UPI001369E3B2|nr:cytochrome c maturation protein CcmE [Saccharibacter sp. 17.LH.SD]MXV43952.1 cytochrome c maturation protein CcmE [Saccharibacter sp. 17.LH.SD]